MKLVWKLLRQHISIPQFVGFFFANLFGMLIVLLGYQFYCDVMPVFTAEDSFMKSDFIIVNKQIGASNAISGRTNTFDGAEISDISAQKFTQAVGSFTSNEYRADASMGINGVNILNSEIFLESVPDNFVEVSKDNWKFNESDKVVPILLPRSYITMYNFGFAQSHSLPKISDGLVGMIDFKIFIQGNGHHDEFKGKVIGFSSRLNTILVPQSFIDWSNNYYSPGKKSDPTRLIMKVGNPADEQIAKYVEKKGYDIEDDKLNAEKTTYFLKMIISMVMIVGLFISILSFYILMLSIYLLVQKNSSKLENLLLIGYSPGNVARPYQMLTAGLNFAVFILACVILFFVRNYYMGIIETLFTDLDETTMLPAITLGIILFLLVTILNFTVIRRRIVKIWKHKE
ncbi:MAG: ABC transporter permease [Prevotella sp.]|jgi:hypothetical protein|nr:ABC transporter permease [Prevotella sp.]MCI1281615.1 ABC transporter permease [Prevotella sp.]